MMHCYGVGFGLLRGVYVHHGYSGWLFVTKVKTRAFIFDKAKKKHRVQSYHFAFITEKVKHYLGRFEARIYLGCQLTWKYSIAKLRGLCMVE